MISIITITFNNYEELVKTINSIPNKPSIESIIINGGSCSKTREYLKAFQGKSISEKDDGIADAFNKGITLSSGEFIMFLNSGDILINSEYPEKAAGILSSDKDFAFTHSNMILVDEVGTELLVKSLGINIGRGMPYTHPTMVVKRELFEQIGKFDIRIKIAMDYDWVVRLEKSGYRGYYFNSDPVVKMNGEGKSIKQEAKAMKECFKILQDHNYLTLPNFLGYALRILLFLIRSLMVRIGLDRLLRMLKKKKYSFNL